MALEHALPTRRLVERYASSIGSVLVAPGTSTFSSPVAEAFFFGTGILGRSFLSFHNVESRSLQMRFVDSRGEAVPLSSVAGYGPRWRRRTSRRTRIELLILPRPPPCKSIVRPGCLSRFALGDPSGRCSTGWRTDGLVAGAAPRWPSGCRASTTPSTRALVDASSFRTRMRGMRPDPSRADTIRCVSGAGLPVRVRASSPVSRGRKTQRSSRRRSSLRGRRASCRTRSLHYPPPLRVSRWPASRRPSAGGCTR